MDWNKLRNTPPLTPPPEPTLEQKIAASLKPRHPPVHRARAGNKTAPVNLKARISVTHREELERRAAARGVSVATILREVLDAAFGAP